MQFLTRCGARRGAALALALALTTIAAPAQNVEPSPRRTPTVDDAYRSIESLRQAFVMGELTPLDMTLLFQQRIESIDRTGPTLRAVLETNPDAAPAAHVAGSDYRAGLAQALTGIPVLIKDNIETGDRMRTTAGSLAFERPSSKDATIVAKLREAGAVILGKANLSEWSGFRGSSALQGWSARGGLTKNPFVLDWSPKGSSSGSAAGVAAGLATVAIGTETYGSIVAPAHAMGLVGLKPTVGLVSRAGIVPVSYAQDSPGPIARSVADAAALLNVIAGSDPTDPLTANADRHVTNYTRFADPALVRGKRIGVLRLHADEDEFTILAIQQAIRALTDRGVTIIENVDIPSMDGLLEDQEALLLAEFKHDIAAYLETRVEQPLRTLDDLIAFNEREATRELAHFGQEVFLAARGATLLDDPSYFERRIRATRKAGPEGIDAVMAEHNLDAIIATPASMAMPSVAGYPVMTVSTGLVEDLPIGVFLFGTKWSEPNLISIGSAIESGRGAFNRPKFVPTLPLGDGTGQAHWELQGPWLR